MLMTDEIIKKTLSKKDSRKLLTLIRCNIPNYVSLITRENSHYYDILTIKKEYQTYLGYQAKHQIDKFNVLIDIHNLYRRITHDESVYLKHWVENYADQQNIRTKQNTMAKNPRQDNKSYVNYGNGYSNAKRIRYPKKTRKSAWKRFYKLFPHLDPKNKKDGNN